MKICNKCGDVKSYDNYHKRKESKDGYNNTCKVCRKIQQQEYRKSGKGKIKDNRYNASKKRYESLYKYWDKNPNKKRCQNKLSNALRDGVLIKPNICDYCSCDSKIEGHHWKYEDQHALDVFWLCKSCHEKEHEIIKVKGYPDKRLLYLKQ